MEIEVADRVKRLPPYLFARIESILAEKRKQGVDLIALGIGDPDVPTPKFIIDAMVKEVQNPKNHNYPSSQGEPDFREAVVRWYKNRFNVDLNPDTQAMNLMGGKEGVANIVRAFVNPGEVVLCPNPGYPVYANGGSTLTDATPVDMPLLDENGFKPDFSKIDEKALKKAKLMYLNYPNNPTAATVDRAFIKEAIEFADENDIIICYDNAYCEMTFDGYKTPSILEIEGGMNHVEFQTCSKMFSMTGDRCGFAAGNDKIIAGLKKVKSQIDSGCPVYIQKAAIVGLDSYKNAERPKEVERNMDEYRQRRDLVVDNLNKLGFDCQKPKGTFYVWFNCRGESMKFAEKLLEVGVVVTPGVGFGKYGENHIRIALTQTQERIKEAFERMSEVL